MLNRQLQRGTTFQNVVAVTAVMLLIGVLVYFIGVVTHLEFDFRLWHPATRFFQGTLLAYVAWKII